MLTEAGTVIDMNWNLFQSQVERPKTYLWQVHKVFCFLFNLAPEVCVVISTQGIAKYLRQKQTLCNCQCSGQLHWYIWASAKMCWKKVGLKFRLGAISSHFVDDKTASEVHICFCPWKDISCTCVQKMVLMYDIVWDWETDVTMDTVFAITV